MGNNITFLVLPVFSSRPSSSVSVPSIRESLRLWCSAKGSPLPTVTWYKNDVNVSAVNKVTSDEFTSELVIGEFQPADQATYRCVARNVYNDTVETNTRICKSTLFMHQLIETPDPRTPGHSGGLTRIKPGFNALLMACRPWGAVDLTKYL